jgi:hypothetical protein
VEGTFLMSFTLMGRPYPVTQHPEDVESGLKGRACREEPHRCCGPDSHDSHYVTVRKKKEYYPCPPREQPDFDEVVVFNPARVLPAASFEFKRRRRTLLWLDDRPDRNKGVLLEYPGCPQQPHLFVEATYPMRQHCSTCRHGLTLDSNPYGTCKERKKAATAAAAAWNAAVKAAEDVPSAEATREEEECKRLLDAATALAAEAQAAADVVRGNLLGQDVKLEEQVALRALCSCLSIAGHECVLQVDVVLFTCVEDATTFMRHHSDLSKCVAVAASASVIDSCYSYPPSLLRIISSRRLFIGDGGLQQFLDTDPAWRFKYPATFMFYGDAAADVSALVDRPNFFKSREVKHCKAFALFKPQSLMFV